MLNQEEKQELDGMRQFISPSDRYTRRLIELERKDIDSAAGPPFERGLPAIGDRLEHPGPWESWESPMDRCVVWFSPDGTGYDCDHGHGCERKFHPVTIANWESTWMRRMPTPATDIENEPTKEQIPNLRTCGVSRAKPETKTEPEWLRRLTWLEQMWDRHELAPNSVGNERRLKLIHLRTLRAVAMGEHDRASMPRAVLERYNQPSGARPNGLNLDATWICEDWQNNHPDHEFAVRTEGDTFFTFRDTLLKSIDEAASELL